MIVALLLIASAAAGLQQCVGWLAARAVAARPWPASTLVWVRASIWSLALLPLSLINLPVSLAPVNEGMSSYRSAATWIHEHVSTESRVVDVTGWTLYYGQQPGYTFADLDRAGADPERAGSWRARRT